MALVSFPKSLDISKQIDKAAGAEREVVGTKTAGIGTGDTYGKIVGSPSPATNLVDITAPATDAAKLWEGFGTALKPAYEPIVLAMLPRDGTFANNALTHGCGGLNVDGCRIETTAASFTDNRPDKIQQNAYGKYGTADYDGSKGRFPANVILSDDPEVVEGFPEAGGGFGVRGSGPLDNRTSYAMPGQGQTVGYGDTGSAARFFYCAKSSAAERGENNSHATVKPLALMSYLCKLVSSPGYSGTLLDPFAGSGSTLLAASRWHASCIGIEQDEGHCQIIAERLGQSTLF